MTQTDRIEIIQADITILDVDAIVNAANNSLLGGGGVDGAIHQAAGPELLAECRTLNGCKTGAAKLTRGHNLTARYVIHTVGPIWHGGQQNEAELLASCYRESLKLAKENAIHTIAFPAISCGVYGYPVKQASEIAMTQVIQHLQNNPEMKKVVFSSINNEISEALTFSLEQLVDSAARTEK